MLCKDNRPTLITSPRYIIQNIFLLHLFKKKKLLLLKGIAKTTHHEMHECNAMQILKAKRKQNIKRRMVTKSIEMKHKDQKSQG